MHQCLADNHQSGLKTGAPFPGCGDGQFTEVPVDCLNTVERGDKFPMLVETEVKNRPRGSTGRSCCSKQNTGIQKDLQALCRPFRETFRNASMASSSSRIQDWMVPAGMSRTGIAAAGCKKTPPSRSSTTIKGLSMRSKPIRRRIAGGNVIPPRLFKVSVVMLIFCNTALRQSSTPYPRTEKYRDFTVRLVMTSYEAAINALTRGNAFKDPEEARLR